MCAIIDANVVAQAFGNSTTDAGEAFRARIDDGRMPLAVGGLLLDELDRNVTFRAWRATALQYGTVRVAERNQVEARTADLRQRGACASDDEHLIALAQVSGARLLFSNEPRLHRDFKNRELIDDPRGKVYSTLQHTSLTSTHRRLLAQRSLCSG